MTVQTVRRRREQEIQARLVTLQQSKMSKLVFATRPSVDRFRATEPDAAVTIRATIYRFRTIQRDVSMLLLCVCDLRESAVER